MGSSQSVRIEGVTLTTCIKQLWLGADATRDAHINRALCILSVEALFDKGEDLFNSSLFSRHFFYHLKQNGSTAPLLPGGRTRSTLNVMYALNTLSMRYFDRLTSSRQKQEDLK